MTEPPCVIFCCQGRRIRVKIRRSRSCAWIIAVQFGFLMINLGGQWSNSSNLIWSRCPWVSNAVTRVCFLCSLFICNCNRKLPNIDPDFVLHWVAWSMTSWNSSTNCWISPLLCSWRRWINSNYWIGNPVVIHCWFRFWFVLGFRFKV